MRVTHPDLVGDLGDQILAADLTLGIRRRFDDRPSRLERESAVINLPESDHVSSAEWVKKLIQLMAF